MSDPGAARRRLIVELCHGAADRQTLQIVAEFASVLELDLHGLFIEDEALMTLAELPFARELRLPTHEWQKLETGRIAAELQRAAQDAQRLLREAAEALGVRNAFEVRRGDPAATIAAVASGSDVIVVAEQTATPAGGLAPAASRLHAAAHGSAASLLLLPGRQLPRRLLPRQGVVAAVLVDAGRPECGTGRARCGELRGAAAGAVAERRRGDGRPRGAACAGAGGSRAAHGNSEPWRAARRGCPACAGPYTGAVGGADAGCLGGRRTGSGLAHRR